MNSFATLTFIYALFTLISSGILYDSFRKKMDMSAVYFLISEQCTMITCIVLVALNTKIVESSNFWTGLANFAFLSAEVAILFSLLSLTKKMEKIWFLLGIFLVALVATSLELIRDHVHPQTSVLLLSICSLSLFIANYLICKFRLSKQLLGNQFLSWFTWFELGLVGYGFIRVLSYFAPAPIIPRETPSTLAVVIFSTFVVIGAFRYMSYIGLRITWVDPENPSQNQLNRALAQAVIEKDQLLRGLIASNRALGISALASSLAHQLSQPLTTIALHADTTRRNLTQAKQDPRLISSLDKISTQSTKLAELVQNLRGLFESRNYQFEPINLQKITEEIIEITKPSLEAKKISLIKDYQGNPIVYGDSMQIQQVMINVLNNAIDALMQGKEGNKKIFISITNNEEFSTLEIRDNGGGIDQAMLADIFELYKTTKQGGLGLGLWLSKAIMERHHGSITASNDATGGAVFKIEIPMYQTPSQ
jgi:signal transduction histidine kinase